MSDAHQNIENESLAALFNGIVVDLQHLAEQELQLAKSEVEDELRRRATSAKHFAYVVATLFLAAFHVCFVFVYLLHGVSSSAPNESGGLSLWSSHLTVALVLVGIAGIPTVIEQARSLLPMLRHQVTSHSKKDEA